MTAARQSNRAAFPITAALVDEFRHVFGDGVKATYVKEGGRTAGKPLDESQYLVISGKNLILNPTKKKTK